MPTKVLVFESDPAFAGELRNELGKLGCSTTIVDDGNVGLQHAAGERPDLILLSIELPRMNGFSVCNKLKKDPNLKDVPLVIMSNESSDETFEQHKKLRTRAEDYVHKPIAFGELLQRVRAFVPLEAPPADSDAAIVIDDEIEIGDDDPDVGLGDDGPGDSIPDVPRAAATARRMDSVDADVDAFAESAFGRLTEPDAAPPGAHVGRNGSASSNGAAAVASGAGLVVTAPAPVRVPSVAPLPAPQVVGVDPREHERVREELADAEGRARELGRALDEAQSELARLRADAGERERLERELADSRAKLAAAPRTGGVSSREFLDLREALNKKDKEILSLKEVVSKKDRQIVESQERALVSERARADVDDRLLAFERELEEAKEKAESLSADRELAKKAADDFRARLEKARAEIESKERQLGEARARHAEEAAAAEERLAAMRAEVDQTLANERAEHARALDEAEQRRRGDLDEARRRHDEQLEAASRESQEEVARATADAELRGQAAVEALRAELEARAARELGEEREKGSRLAGELATALEEAASLRQARDDLQSRLDAAAARVAALESEGASVRDLLASTEQRLQAESGRAERAHAKQQADRQSLERAKDALAIVLAHIEETES